MTKKELLKLNEFLTAEYLKKGGRVTRVAAKKIAFKNIARCNSPKRRRENRWDLQFEKPVAQG